MSLPFDGQICRRLNENTFNLKFLYIMKVRLQILAFGLVVLMFGCKKKDKPLPLPVLTTSAATLIKNNSAQTGGNIASDGGLAITQRGVVWSTLPNPTIALPTKTIDGNGTGTFTSAITGLSANTTYYVRAYATNSAGTSYGNEVSFMTTNVDVTTGLVAHYPFNGNANDESGKGNHGTVYNATLTTDRYGVVNGAYSFNGNLNNYISLNQPFFEGKQISTFTVHTIVKANSFANNPNIWGKAFFWGEVNMQMNADSSLQLWWANAFTGNKYSTAVTNPGALSVGKWVGIDVVFQNSLMQIYINGSPVTTKLSWVAQGGASLSTVKVDATCNFATNAGTSRFGQRLDGTGWVAPLNGIIDEFSLYDRALTPEQIKYLSGQ